MFCFSLGVSRIGDDLPGAVYALLSGFNAATVGIIALAAVQLSQKVITDKLTRILVFLGGAAGMLYTALWYFPMMAAAGIATMTWDLKIIQKLSRLLDLRERQAIRATELEESRARTGVPVAPRTFGISATTSSQHGEAVTGSNHLHHNRQDNVRSNITPVPTANDHPVQSLETPLPPQRYYIILSWQRGLVVLVTFFASFLTIMLVRGLYPSPTRIFSLFANL